METQKKFFIFQETELSYENAKTLLMFQEVTFHAAKMKIFLHFRKRIFLAPSMKIKNYKEAKFSKSKYFLKIIMKRFFSFYNILFYTQQGFVFHFLRDFCNVHDQIVAFFFLFFRKIVVSFTSIFLKSFFIFWIIFC